MKALEFEIDGLAFLIILVAAIALLESCESHRHQEAMARLSPATQPIKPEGTP